MTAHVVFSDIRRGSTIALQAGELELPARANVGIIGINGAGKSTLMHALAGCLRARAGQIELRDGTAGNAPCAAYSPQQPTFPEWLRVEEVLRFYGLELPALDAVLPGLLLEELRATRCAALSVGQRQALSVAISLGLECPLTLLDEPFASIDFRRRLALIALLRARTGRGLVLVSSQNGADLLETCSWMVVLREGRCVFSGPREELAGGADDAAPSLRSFEENVLTLISAQRSA